MRKETAAPAASAGASVRAVGTTIFLDYLLSNLGYYTLLPVLPILIPQLHPGTDAWWVGTALLVTTFAVRGGSLLVGGILRRLPARTAMLLGLLSAGVGFGTLPWAPGIPGLLCCLGLAGLGISVNTLSARAYIAVALSEQGDRTTIFSAIQVAVNISAALGPVAANFLFSGGQYGLLLLIVAVLYAGAAASVVATVPAGLRLSDDSGRRPMRFGLAKVLATDSRIRKVSAVTAVGGLLYGQFFSAFALLVADLTENPAVRAGFFSLNGVLVVALQIPVTIHMKKAMDRGVSPMRYLFIGLVIFSLAFLVLGVSGAGLLLAYAAVVVFSLAETFFTPTVNTAFVSLAGDRPVVDIFNLRQAATAVGESLGSFAGGTFYLLAAAHGLLPGYWFGLAAIGAVTAILMRKERG